MALKYKSTAVFLRPDPHYKNLLAGKFLNCLMRQGKKSVAERIFYECMELIRKRIPNVEPLEVFETAVNNVRPLLEVRSRRVGGATYQIPVEVRKPRQTSLAIRWILEAARAKKAKPMAERLADELCDAYKKEGAAIMKRENIHKMAEGSRAFAHFAW